MMSARLTWTNNSAGHDGTRIYRDTAPMDPQALPAPIAEVAAGAAEFVDAADPPEIGYVYYRVADYAGGDSVVSDELRLGSPPPSIGDDFAGGVYAGMITYGDGRKFHIVAARESDISAAVKWGYYTSITGCDDNYDGQANQDVMLARLDGGEDYGSHPPEAFIYCRDFTDGEGNSDYYLPAREEIKLVWGSLYQSSHPDYPNSTFYDKYWASTEVDESFADIISLDEGGIIEGGWKDTPNYYALPIRRIAA